MPTDFQKAKRRVKLANGNWSKSISYLTSSESVEMTDGTDLQTKIDDMDDDLVSEVNRATGAEQTIANNLTTHDNNTIKHITATERTNWDDANSKKHEHSNKSVLDNTTASYTTDEKDKLSGIEAGAQVNTVTGVKGDSESSYRIGDINITKANIGLGDVGNYKAVSTVASQGLSDTEKSNARENIGAGTSNFSGSYNDLVDKPIYLTSSLSAGQTVISFIDNKINNNSVIDVYTDVYGINVNNMSVNDNTLTLTFDAQSTDINVKVKIS